jgi:hypothetical protein
VRDLVEVFHSCVPLFFSYTVAMGGERASTTRMRLAARICSNCKLSVPPPHMPDEKFCPKCQTASGPKRRVYLHFMSRTGWHCQFLEADLKTSLPKKLFLPDPRLSFSWWNAATTPVWKDDRLLSTLLRLGVVESGWS